MIAINQQQIGAEGIGCPESGEDGEGHWTVWNRQQTQRITCGRTFADAIEAARATGESAVVLVRTPGTWPRQRRKRSEEYTVAVFIARPAAPHR